MTVRMKCEKCGNETMYALRLPCLTVGCDGERFHVEPSKAPETPEAVREEAAKALMSYRKPERDCACESDGNGEPTCPDCRMADALAGVDAVAPLLRAADQREIARLTKDLEECENVLISTRHLYAENAANWKAENARLTAELNDEQVAHNRIAELCHKVGVSTPDGTPIGAVERLTVRLAEVEGALERLADAEARYRYAYVTHGDGSRESGYQWDQMRKRGNEARTVLALEAPRE